MCRCAYTTFGSNGPDPRSDTAVLESEAAAEAHTEHIVLENVALSRDSINELGDLVLGSE